MSIKVEKIIIDSDKLKKVISETLSEFGELPIGLFGRFVDTLVTRIKENTDDRE